MYDTKPPRFGEDTAAGVDRRSLDLHAEDEARGLVEADGLRGLDHGEGPNLEGDSSAVAGAVEAMVLEVRVANYRIPVHQRS